MRYLVLLALLLSFVILPVLAIADTPEDLRTLGDTLVGENPSCPLYASLYVAKTFKDAVNLPIVGKADWRSELSYTSDINSINNNNSIMLKTGLEF